MRDDRPHASIGEVLALLRDEFPDITISKIRFLESQGLIDPERTPSGYRKFYEADVERLRWILRQQRENYLPLKVIKGRLVGEPATDPPVPGPGPAAGAGAAAAGSARVLTGSAPSGTSMTLTELATATGLSSDDLTELERFGLIGGRSVGGTTYYDEQAFGVASLAAGFMRFGVEARHLRMYRTAAEREAGFLEQVVMPMLKQRNPEARRQALDTLDELARLGQGLRAAMLRQALREYLEG